MQSNFDQCRNQKTFRPKKSAPSGSKVGIFAGRMVDGFFCIFCLFMVYVQPIEPSMHFGYKYRVLNFKNTSMPRWVVET